MTESTEAPENPDEDERQSIEVDLTLTKKNGVVVPMTIKFLWPEDEGLLLLKFLNEPDRWLDETSRQLMQHLISIGDGSMLAAAARIRDNEEQDDYDD